MSIHNKCLVCESEGLKPLKGYYIRHGLIKCKNCGFVFMERIPTAKDLETHYATYSYKETDVPSPITIKRYHELLDEFEKYRKNNRLLDVGCVEIPAILTPLFRFILTSHFHVTKRAIH